MIADPPRPKGSRGGWWVVVQTILLAALIVSPQAWRWTATPRALWVALGAGLVASGLGLAARAILDLGPNLTPFPVPRRRGILVQTGAYARTRHPIYGGLIIAAVGWALWRMSGLHLLLAAILTLFLSAKAGREELFLADRFPEYVSYRSRTRRLIPWLF
ncbi:MAG: methyltransferase family protein [bacterium]